MKTEKQNIGAWIRRFLMEHLVGERNLARNTQTSYRDTLALFLPFASKRLKKGVDRLCINDISSDVVRDFLQYLEKERDCSDLSLRVISVLLLSMPYLALLVSVAPNTSLGVLRYGVFLLKRPAKRR